MRDLDYLKLLAKEYPTVKAASSEIINLMAIRGLPKGTGISSATCTGNTKRLFTCSAVRPVLSARRSETFGYVISDEEEIALANLIYYPSGISGRSRKRENSEDWQRITIYRLVRICKEVSSKFTRSKVRKNAAGIRLYHR